MKIFCAYADIHIMSFIITKVNEIQLSVFRGVALTRKTGLTDWLTDWLTDGWVKNWIPPAAHCVGHNNAINVIWPKYYRYCVKQFIINQSINVTWRVKAYLSLIYHWTVWFLNPTQRVAGGIQFLTHPSVSERSVSMLSPFFFFGQRNSSETAQQNFVRRCS